VGTSATLALGDVEGTRVAYIADEDAHGVRTVDLSTGAELEFTPLGGAPGQLLITADGRLLVAIKDRASVAVFEPSTEKKSLELRCLVPTPTEPIALASTPDSTRILVTSRWGHALSVLDSATLKRLSTVDLPRDPAAIVTSRDGQRAFVSHIVGARMSVVDLTGDRAVALDLHQVERAVNFEGTKSVRWSYGQGYTLVRSGEGKILAPGVLANPSSGPDAPPSTGYGPGGAPTALTEISTIDDTTQQVGANPVLVSSTHTDCLLPRAAAFEEKSGRLYVACLGDGVRVYDGRAKRPNLNPVRRLMVADGPTGLALFEEGKRLAVWSQFARTLSVFDITIRPYKPKVWGPQLTTPPVESEETIALMTNGSPRATKAFQLPSHEGAAISTNDTLALGRRLFFSADAKTIAGDGRVCASCHPDGRDDGLTWSTLDGPRQTPILAARLLDTAPYSWDGSNADLSSHVRRTVKRLMGFGLDPKQREALIAYLGSMSVPRDETPIHDKITVARGQAIFQSPDTGCATCHSGGSTSDAAGHDVATQVKSDRAPAFDTPSLRFLSQSAPYFHDGRYATIADLLKGSDGTMGHTGHLSDSDRSALTAYLESL
jgi:mono/diheme cytochrome c family protein